MSLLIVAIGWLVTLFDDQYASNSIAARALIGVGVGLLSAGFMAPISALVAIVVGYLGTRRR